jgi:hypothetical protein
MLVSRWLGRPESLFDSKVYQTVVPGAGHKSRMDKGFA